MATSAGRVMPIPKGAYDASVTYNMLDMVRYNGSTYVCKQTCVGQTPADGAYWMLSAEGASGASVSSFNSRTGAVVPAKNDYDIGQIKPLTGATQGQVPVVNANGDFVMGNPASSGHTIEDEYGTPMTARENLEFTGGATVTDDSTNNRTLVKIDDLVTLTQAQYNNLSQAEKEDLTKLYFISDEGGTDLNLGDLSDMNLGTPQDGDYPAWNANNGKHEYRHEHGYKELWKNPNPTNSYGTGTVTINNFDVTKFDDVEIEFAIFSNEVYGNKKRSIETDVLSSTPTAVTVLDMYVSSWSIYVPYRTFTLAITGTTLTVQFNGAFLGHMTSYGTGASEADNTKMIPVRILGLIHND